nr:hypothetical protein [Nitrosomonas nitrosa]
MADGVDPELRVKHLEMIQAVIARIAGYSATVKNICVTAVTALAGVAIANDISGLGWLALVLVLIFALVDAQYLRIERRFRTLFDQARAGDWKAMPSFSLDIGSVASPPLVESALSWSVLTFYLPLAVVSLIVERMF